MSFIKKLFDVGVKDVDYPLYKWHYEGSKQIIDWCCPYYLLWKELLRRCYSPKEHIRYPTYVGCEVSPTWYSLNNFTTWVKDQKQHDLWLSEKGKSRKDKKINFHLDKDILSVGSKIYSPETCVFIPNYLNSLLLIQKSQRNAFSLGVGWDKKLNKFRAYISIGSTYKYLGHFDKEVDAHKAWQKAKAQNILNVKSNYQKEDYSDLRVVLKLQEIAERLLTDYSLNIETKTLI